MTGQSFSAPVDDVCGFDALSSIHVTLLRHESGPNRRAARDRPQARHDGAAHGAGKEPAVIRRVLLVCGVTSSVLYLTAIDLIAPLLHPSYHVYTSQMVSELLALSAPTRPLLTWPMLAYNMLVFAFAAGVWASAEGRRARVLTAAALVGYAACSSVGLLLAPMDLRSAGISDQTRLHIWATALQGLFIALVLVFGAFVHARRFRLYSLATLAICILFGALASLEAAQGSMRWIGLTERVNIYAWMGWLAALSGSLLPTKDPSAASREGPRGSGGTGIGALIKRHPVTAYYALTFALSWGAFVVADGAGLLAGSDWQSDPQFTVAVLAMLAGPPVAGLLVTTVVAGTAGLAELGARLRRWRVGGRWYAVALLTSPVVQLSVLLTLSQRSQAFLPAIVSTDDKMALLASGIVVGVVGGFVEEVGWTGFAIPRLVPRFGVLATGLIVGVLWTAWHAFQMWRVGSSSAGDLPFALFLPAFFLTNAGALMAYRVLMVWVYDRTGSVFVPVLMHASHIVTTLFVLAPPTTGTPFLTYSVLFAAALWGLVAVVGLSSSFHVSRPSLTRGRGTP
jgi:uncharacterized protein